MLTVPIKVSGITSLTDARYCAGMGVFYLGLSFGKEGSRGMEPLEFSAIRAWIEGIEWVGEYMGSSVNEVVDLARDYKLNFWEVDNYSIAKELQNHGLKTAVRLTGLNQFNPDLHVSYVTCPVPAVSKSGLWNPRNAAGQPAILLEGISGTSSLEETWKAFPGCGFHFRSGPEDRPGWMDLSGLQDMLEKLDEISL